MPEQGSSEVHKARNGIVSEGCSLISLFAHQTEANISRLYHVYVVCTIADSQSDFSVREFLHKSDDLGFLSRGGAVNNNRLGSNEECTKLSVHKRVIKGDSDDHS